MGPIRDISAGGKKLPTYFAEPEGEIKGGIILVHEVWGLNEHIASIANRFAAQGYLVLAPNLLHDTEIAARHAAELAGLQQDLFNPEKRSEAQPKMRLLTAPIREPAFAQKAIAQLQGLVDYLSEQSEVGGRIAVCGFCFGGSYTFSLAVAEPRLKVAIPFYGHAPAEVRELEKINCPVLAFYGERDEDLMASLPALRTHMQEAHVAFEAIVYPDCGHAFFNDTNTFTYNPEAAADAWHRTLAFLERHV